MSNSWNTSLERQRWLLFKTLWFEHARIKSASPWSPKKLLRYETYWHCVVEGERPTPGWKGVVSIDASQAIRGQQALIAVPTPCTRLFEKVYNFLANERTPENSLCSKSRELRTHNRLLRRLCHEQFPLLLMKHCVIWCFGWIRLPSLPHSLRLYLDISLGTLISMTKLPGNVLAINSITTTWDWDFSCSPVICAGSEPWLPSEHRKAV